MNRLLFRGSWSAAGAFGSRLIFLVLALVILAPTPSAARITRWLDAGDLAADSGKFEAAREYYARALDVLPGGSSVAYCRLVSLSLVAEDYDLAQVYLYAAAAHESWTDNRREQLRFILDHGESSALSSALVYAALDRYQSDPRTLSQVARQQIDHHAWDELDATLRQWLLLEPQNGSALYWWGLFLAPVDPAAADGVLARAETDDQWGGYAKIAREALDGYGVLPLTEAHTRLGLALVSLHEWAFAERALQLAVEVNSVNPTALAYLGLARDQQARDGLPSIQAALAFSPNDPVLHYIEGLHWQRTGDHKAAFDSFSRAYWLDPSNPALAVEAATSLQHLGELDEAVRWYEQAVTLAPSEIEWTRLLAAFYADTDYQLDGAGLRYIEEAAASADDDVDLQVSLGWAYYQVGQTDRARDVLSAALVGDSANGRGWYYWGVLLEQSGDSQAALAAYETALAAAGSETEFGLLATRAVERLSGTAP